MRTLPSAWSLLLAADWLLFATHCQPVIPPIPAAAREADLVLLAHGDATGRVSAVTRIDRERTPLWASESDAFFVFWLLATDLIAPDGLPPDAELLRDVRPALEGDGAGSPGSCRRCQLPAVAAPAVVVPGDVCPLPAFAGAGAFLFQQDQFVEALDASLLDRARAAIRLAWPGDCGCPLPPEASPLLASEPVLPDRDPIPLDVDVLSADGTYTGLSSQLQVQIDPRGIRSDSEDPLGHITAAAVLPRARGTLVAAERRSETESGSRYTLLGPGLAPTPLPDLSVVAAHEILPVPGDPDAIELLGSVRLVGRPVVPATARCRVVGQTGSLDLGCGAPEVQRETSRCEWLERGPDQPFHSAATAANGAAVALGEQGRLYFRRSSAEVWSCDPREPPVIPGRVLFAKVLSIGDRAFACGTRWGEGEQDAFLISGRLDPFDPAVPSSLPVFAVTATAAGVCESLSLTPDRTRVRAVFSSGAIEVDADATIVERYTRIGGGARPGVLYPELPHRGVRLLVSGEWEVVVGRSGAVFRRRGAEPFRRIYGPVDDDDHAFPAVVPHPSGRGFLIAGGRSGLVSLPAGGPASPLGLEGARPEDGFSPRAAVWDRRSSRLVVAGKRDDRGALLAIDVERPALDDLGYPSDRWREPLVGAVELVPGWLLLLDRAGRLVQLRDAEYEEIAAPPAPEARWVSLDGAHGAAWVASRRGLARITAGSASRARLEPFAFDRTRPGPLGRVDRSLEEVDMGPIAVHCPDEAVFATLELEGSDTSVAWEIRSTPCAALPRSAPIGGGSLWLCPFHGYVDGPAEASSEKAIAVVGRGPRTTFVFWRRAYRPGQVPIDLPFPVISAAMDDRGAIAFGAQLGRVALSAGR